MLTRQGELRAMPLRLPELVATTLLEHRSVAAALVRMVLGRTVLPEMLTLETGRMQTEMPRTRTQVRKPCLQRPQTRASTVLKHAVGIRTLLKSTSVRYPRRFLCHHCLYVGETMSIDRIREAEELMLAEEQQLTQMGDKMTRQGLLKALYNWAQRIPFFQSLKDEDKVCSCIRTVKNCSTGCSVNLSRLNS